MDALAKLIAVREIERVILDYAAYNDAADWEAVASMFVSNGRVSRPIAPNDFTEGRDAILAAFKARPPRKTRHIVSNIRVDIDGDEATASSQIMLFTGPDLAPLVGSYADRLARTEEGWRFVERRGSLDFPKDG
jgi:ketosteroid isomerase-like protein